VVQPPPLPVALLEPAAAPVPCAADPDADALTS